MLERPATAIIPSEAKTQIKMKIIAICLNGLGRIPTNHIKTTKMRMSQIVMASPLNFNKTI